MCNIEIAGHQYPAQTIIDMLNLLKRVYNSDFPENWNKRTGVCENLTIILDVRVPPWYIIPGLYDSVSAESWFAVKLFPIGIKDSNQTGMQLFAFGLEKYDYETEYGRNRQKFIKLFIIALSDLLTNNLIDKGEL